MAFLDPYIDPSTGILRNKVGARTQVALDTAEGDLVYVRMVQLLASPPEPTSDLSELCAIHRHLFQDVYDWAGEIRTVDIRKPVEDAVPFMPVSFVSAGSLITPDGTCAGKESPVRRMTVLQGSRQL